MDERIIQIGTVMDVSGTKARVRHEDTGITSDWLIILQRPGEVVTLETAGSHTHDVSEGSCGSAGDHTHTAAVASWAPKINDKVLVLYLPMKDSDGYILGRI